MTQKTPTTAASVPGDAAIALRGLAEVIRKHGTCAPMALEVVAERLEKYEAARTLDAQPSGMAGDWVMVPREPTEAMLDATIKASCEAESVYDDDRPADAWEKFGLRKNRIRHQYAALIAAAPPIAQQGGVEELRAALIESKATLEWLIEQGGGPECEHESGVVCFCREKNTLATIEAALAAQPAPGVGGDVTAKFLPKGSYVLPDSGHGGELNCDCFQVTRHGRTWILAAKWSDQPDISLLTTRPAESVAQGVEPIKMILHCPQCQLQHIDAPDDRTPDWKNEPHRSHLCHGCGFIWRPADVATEGVAAIETKGKADSPTPATGSGGDRSMAMHWIDRYAAGIDDECQLDRVADALFGTVEAVGYVCQDGSVTFYTEGSFSSKPKPGTELFTHPAPAGGGAVIVDDAMVERACKRYAFREDGAVWPDAYSEHEVAAERVLMREFLLHALTAKPGAEGSAIAPGCGDGVGS